MRTYSDIKQLENGLQIGEKTTYINILITGYVCGSLVVFILRMF